MLARSLKSTATQVGIKATMQMVSKTESLNAHAMVPVIRSALHQPTPLITDPKWSTVKNVIASAAPAIESVDFSNVLQKAASTPTFLMSSFVQAQQEKNQRADEMIGPLVRETANKIDDLLSLSSTEQTSMKEQLKAARDDHKDNEKQLKKIHKTASFLQRNTTELIQKVIGTELAEVLSNKIDPHVLDKFCAGLRGTARITSQVVPALRVLNNLSLAYDTAKVLYPEHINELENYVVNALQEHQQSLKNGLMEQGRSFKDRLSSFKKEAMPTIGQTNINTADDSEIFIHGASI